MSRRGTVLRVVLVWLYLYACRLRRCLRAAPVLLALGLVACDEEDPPDAGVDCVGAGEACECFLRGESAWDGVVACTPEGLRCRCPQCRPGHTQQLGCDGWHTMHCGPDGRWVEPRACR